MPPVSPGSSALFNHQIEKKNYTSNPNFPVNTSIEINPSAFSTNINSKPNSNKEVLTPHKEQASKNNSNKDLTVSINNKESNNRLIDSVALSKTVYQIPVFYDKQNPIPQSVIEDENVILEELPDIIQEKDLEKIFNRLFDLNSMFTNAVFRKINAIIHNMHNYYEKKDFNDKKETEDKTKEELEKQEKEDKEQIEIEEKLLKPITKENFIK